MGATKNWNVEFLDHNTERRYPLAQHASCRDITGEFVLPNDFLVGLYLPISAAFTNIRLGHFTLRSIAAYATGFVITIGYENEAGDILPVATASFSRDLHKAYDAYQLRGLGDFYDSFGQIIIGKLDNIDQQPAGQWNFNLSGGALEIECMRPQLRGVSQLRIQNGTTLSDPLTGDIVLRAGANMRITPISEVGKDTVIQFDAIAGEGLSKVCICAGDFASGPIKTINNIGPTSNGNFTLLGSDCLTIDTIQNGLQLNDVCSKPCCGCEELATVTQQLEQFGRSATTSENFLTSLEARVSQMDQAVLASKLGDRGCITCN